MLLTLSTLLLQDTAQALPPETGGPGLVEFFAQSGPMARLVLGVLVVFSLVSWAIILGKSVQFHRARVHSDEFLRVFRRSSRFSEVSAAAERLGASPLVGVFRVGYQEIDDQIKAAKGAAAGVSGAGGYRIRSLPALERSLQRAIRVEVTVFTRWTPFLATTAAATPFIGLFGTVWGIMVAFQQIGATGSTSIVTVAPGIAEALINTAGGLVAAIPALIGYNYFAHRARDLRGRLEDFALELLNLSERNFT
jgi:biopolymer transport protein TolQ